VTGRHRHRCELRNHLSSQHAPDVCVLSCVPCVLGCVTGTPSCACSAHARCGRLEAGTGRVWAGGHREPCPHHVGDTTVVCDPPAARRTPHVCRHCRPHHRPDSRRRVSLRDHRRVPVWRWCVLLVPPHHLVLPQRSRCFVLSSCDACLLPLSDGVTPMSGGVTPTHHMT